MSIDQPRTKIHWKRVETRNPRSFVFPPAKPDSAKQDLRKFVHQNQLCYRVRKDAISDFEDLFDQLHLDSDEDLLDRAERRDLPARVQLMVNKLNTCEESKSVSSQQSSSTNKSDRTLYPKVPTRRAAMPNVILDDYAFRRYNKTASSSQLDSMTSQDDDEDDDDSWYRHRFYRNPLHEKNKSICYLSLASFDDCSLNGSVSMESPDLSAIPFKQRKEANIVCDDVLNRKIRQSPAANVAPPHPPFGIPNSPVISYLHTFPQSDYSRVEPDVNQLQKPRHRSRDPTPHLINDDMAFRSLRKEYKGGIKESTESLDSLRSSYSTSNLYVSVRSKLKPIKPTSSVASSTSESLSSPDASFDCWSHTQEPMLFI